MLTDKSEMSTCTTKITKDDRTTCTGPPVSEIMRFHFSYLQTRLKNSDSFSHSPHTSAFELRNLNHLSNSPLFIALLSVLITYDFLGVTLITGFMTILSVRKLR